ncbi:unnamed protein product [Soboliphyme baturini]|uniref:ABC transporter ATP-binding protein n=1 Tax=Soboliphyme baturini TaxID=241478 RepID=A0A183J1V5_9BILA|nr:unnamed protein product [Soboliphyme baturini]
MILARVANVFRREGETTTNCLADRPKIPETVKKFGARIEKLCSRLEFTFAEVETLVQGQERRKHCLKRLLPKPKWISGRRN